MILGLPFVYYALLGSFGLSAVLAVLWVSAMDRSDARERARRGQPEYVGLPPMMAIPTKWRRR
jgi:hypothetical protein